MTHDVTTEKEFSILPELSLSFLAQGKIFFEFQSL